MHHASGRKRQKSIHFNLICWYSATDRERGKKWDFLLVCGMWHLAGWWRGALDQSRGRGQLWDTGSTGFQMWDLESTGWYGNHLEGTEAWKEMQRIRAPVLTGSDSRSFYDWLYSECGIHMMDMLQELRLLMDVTWLPERMSDFFGIDDEVWHNRSSEWDLRRNSRSWNHGKKYRWRLDWKCSGKNPVLKRWRSWQRWKVWQHHEDFVRKARFGQRKGKAVRSICTAAETCRPMWRKEAKEETDAWGEKTAEGTQENPTWKDCAGTGKNGAGAGYELCLYSGVHLCGISLWRHMGRIWGNRTKRSSEIRLAKTFRSGVWWRSGAAILRIPGISARYKMQKPWPAWDARVWRPTADENVNLKLSGWIMFSCAEPGAGRGSSVTDWIAAQKPGIDEVMSLIRWNAPEDQACTGRQWRSKRSGIQEYGGDDIYESDPKYHPAKQGQFFHAGLNMVCFRFSNNACVKLLMIHRKGTWVIVFCFPETMNKRMENRGFTNARAKYSYWE